MGALPFSNQKFSPSFVINSTKNSLNRIYSNFFGSPPLVRPSYARAFNTQNTLQFLCVGLCKLEAKRDDFVLLAAWFRRYHHDIMKINNKNKCKLPINSVQPLEATIFYIINTVFLALKYFFCSFVRASSPFHKFSHSFGLHYFADVKMGWERVQCTCKNYVIPMNMSMSMEFEN